MRDIIQAILQFNRGRLDSSVRLKYQKMQESAFGFLRGSAHLFYADWPAASPLNEAPHVWVSGDLHLANFGSYKGDDGLVYFDINDFDEAALAPCTWELARLLTSFLVVAPSLGFSPEQSIKLCNTVLATYSAALLRNKPRTVEREDATGPVKDLLLKVSSRKRDVLLQKYTEKAGRALKLRSEDEGVSLAIKSEADKTKIIGLVEKWAATQSNPAFFKVLDITRRIAGTGSLGLERYMLLVEGKGSPDQNYLLDLKAALGSSLPPYISQPQPSWPSEASRIVETRRRIQSVPPRLLAALTIEQSSFILRELQPKEDRVRPEDYKGKLNSLENLLVTMAGIIAWGQLRSSNWQGSSTHAELSAFTKSAKWHKPLVEYVQTYAKQVEADYKTFREACKSGKIQTLKNQREENDA